MQIKKKQINNTNLEAKFVGDDGKEMNFTELCRFLRNGKGEDIVWIAYTLRGLNYDDIPASRAGDVLAAGRVANLNFFKDQTNAFKKEYIHLLDEISKFVRDFTGYCREAGYHIQ